MSANERPRLVLAGGGHAHVLVLEAFAAAPPPAALTLVVDKPRAIYSGMVPGLVAGMYRREQVEIDVVALARRCGAEVVLQPVTGFDAGHRRLHLGDGGTLAYDLASIDIGSTVAGLDTPGVREHAIPSRPIDGLIDRTCRLEAERAGAALRVVVVGGGAGGVELAFCLQARLEDRGQVTLVHDGGEVLARHPRALVRAVRRHAARRGIGIRTGVRVAAVHADRVALASGEDLPADAVLWVTGPAAHAVLRQGDLPLDDRGFLRVRSTLQVEGRDDLFAAGDCATLVEHPQTAKAGVYAVRQGPVLAANLRARLAGEPLRSYIPQRDFLTLLNLGDGRAVGAKWGLTFSGRWVMRWKDRIDRRFVERFR